MAGDRNGEALRAYLSRLLGTPVTDDDLLVLRSVQKAALASWARKSGTSLPPALFRSRQGFRISDLAKDGETEPGPRPAVRIAPDPRDRAGPVMGVGIDIEDVDSLPRPADYRADPFFRDHFSDAEIAHCLQQGDVAASFCGVWAAKEAVVKSGAVGPALPRLADVAISHDELGRPSHPGCHLSISRTRHAAVAVCLRVLAPGAERDPREASLAASPG